MAQICCEESVNWVPCSSTFGARGTNTPSCMNDHTHTANFFSHDKLDHTRSHGKFGAALSGLSCHAATYATDYLTHWWGPRTRPSFLSRLFLHQTPVLHLLTLLSPATSIGAFNKQLAAQSCPIATYHVEGWLERLDLWLHQLGPQAEALSTLEYTQEHFVTTWAHNLLPTGRHMKRIGQTELDLCLSYHAAIETAPHILACIHWVQW